MLNIVTGDLQRNWVTLEKSENVAVWCHGSDGFLCLWLSKSAHRHWHRHLPQALPHKYRLAHATLTSSVRVCVCVRLSHVSSLHSFASCFSTHKYAAESSISAVTGEKKNAFHVEFIKQFECDYVNELCLIHATGHLESTLTVITSTHSQAFISGLAVYNCWITWYETAFI